jgi:predicted nucleotidyltransferase
MEEFSRPATLDDLKLLLRSLNEHGVDYLLIGGYALAAHGYLRATTDIDLLVPGTVQAGQRTKDALMVLPDRAAKDIDPTWFEEGGNIRVADAFVVDILLNANGQSFDSLRRYAETIDLDGIPVCTVSLQGLLLTKQTMRDKDVADRIVIERALAVLEAQRGDPD